MTAAPSDALRSSLGLAATITGDRLDVLDPGAFRGPLTDRLVRDAVFAADSGNPGRRALGHLGRQPGARVPIGLHP